MKRKPLLVDEVITGGLAHGFYQKKFVARMSDQLIQAKRFVLDEDAARHLGRVIAEAPEAIAYGQEFALRPFDRMYVELPFAPLFETVTGMTQNKDTGDATLGYFYNGPLVYVFTKGYHDGRNVAMMPLRYRLNRPFTIAQELEVCQVIGTSRIGLDAFFWGTPITKLVDGDAVRAFRAHHSFELLGDHGGQLSVSEAAIGGFLGTWMKETMIESSSGDLRNIIAILLLLNQPSQDILITDVAPVRAMLHNKAHTYLRHSVVKLLIDPVPRIKTMLKGASGVWRREHDVRGHFCHNEQARNAFCDPHDWQEYAVNQWRCMTCAGLRWWRKEHRRGHKEKGKVQTTYEVTTP